MMVQPGLFDCKTSFKQLGNGGASLVNLHETIK